MFHCQKKLGLPINNCKYFIKYTNTAIIISNKSEYNN